MSILIRGMEMPKSCNECIMSIEQACMINGNIISDYWARLDRPTDCPLVELPPHGGLIDSSVAMINISKQGFMIDKDGYVWMLRKHAYKAVEDTPAIIEAEGVE